MKQKNLNYDKNGVVLNVGPEYALPVGMAEFETWSDRIIEACGPVADKDSMKYVLASNILHLPHNESSYPDSTFIKALRKAAANQVASQVFQDIKAKQAAEAAAKLQTTVEVTPAPQGANSDVKQS